MLWTLHATGAPLLWLFIVPELAWGVAQWLPVESKIAPAAAWGGRRSLGRLSGYNVDPLAYLFLSS
jgi:hypothetical protein